jgi:hypothetical protein
VYAKADVLKTVNKKKMSAILFTETASQQASQQASTKAAAARHC